MQRLVDVLQILAYLVGIAVVITVGVQATTVLADLHRGLERDRVVHEQMLKDHVQALKDHERLMERR